MEAFALRWDTWNDGEPPTDAVSVTDAVWITDFGDANDETCTGVAGEDDGLGGWIEAGMRSGDIGADVKGDS